jgi:hypothetical protein
MRRAITYTLLFFVFICPLTVTAGKFEAIYQPYRNSPLIAIKI